MIDLSDILSRSVGSLAGVGPKKSEAYAKMGIHTLSDLISHYPRAYENRGDIKTLFEAYRCGGKCAVLLTVATEPSAKMIRRGMHILKFRAYDDTGSCDLTFFNQPYLKDKFPLGATFRFYGKVEAAGKRFTMSSPVFEYYDEVSPPRDLVAIYRMTEGLSIKQITENVNTALAACEREMDDYLPLETLEKHRLCSRRTALRNIHIPEDYRALAAAKRRLIFDEFFFFSLGIGMTKEKSRPTGAPRCPDSSLKDFVACLPYELTDGQKKAINDVARDMKSDISMNRMIVGDVGCGKTVCAAAAMYIAVKNGRQAALMAPTEILARQHYLDLSDLLGRLGVKVELLIGATPIAQKKRIKAALADGSADVVIGTQALLSDGVEFHAPGLVVTDEQHRFGVNQRAALAEKNKNAHLLVMSATPIPRSMALIMYGDLDVSRIEGMPPGRQRVDTFAVNESYRPRLEAFIEKQVGAGGQVYVVCPAVEESEDGELDLSQVATTGEGPREITPMKTAVEFSEKLASRFPEYRVAFIHGKLKSGEKEEVMHDFSDGKIDILVSTTVIEVGVNVPNACLMIVENADRFGLSQLHQLRGRVGRGKRKSYCILVSDAAKKDGASVASKRLNSLCTLYDGYAIAEQDLLLRGPGDFFRTASDDSIRQSGGIRLPLAEQCDDTSLMNAAFAEASELLAGDPELSEHATLRSLVLNMMTPEAGTLN